MTQAPSYSQDSIEKILLFVIQWTDRKETRRKKASSWQDSNPRPTDIDLQARSLTTALQQLTHIPRQQPFFFPTIPAFAAGSVTNRFFDAKKKLGGLGKNGLPGVGPFFVDQNRFLSIQTVVDRG